MTKTDTPQHGSAYGRNQIRRAMRKVHKRTEAQSQRDADKAALAAMRAGRRPNPRAKRIPGLLTMTGRPYKKEHGKFNRSIIHETVEIVPAITVKVGRKTVILVPQRGYERTVHATKGFRCVRMSASALDQHLEAA